MDHTPGTEVWLLAQELGVDVTYSGFDRTYTARSTSFDTDGLSVTATTPAQLRDRVRQVLGPTRRRVLEVVNG